MPLGLSLLRARGALVRVALGCGEPAPVSEGWLLVPPLPVPRQTQALGGPSGPEGLFPCWRA